MSWISCFTEFYPVVKFYDSIILMIILLTFLTEIEQKEQQKWLEKGYYSSFHIKQSDSIKQNLRNLISFHFVVATIM